MGVYCWIARSGREEHGVFDSGREGDYIRRRGGGRIGNGRGEEGGAEAGEYQAGEGVRRGGEIGRGRGEVGGGDDGAWGGEAVAEEDERGAALRGAEGFPEGGEDVFVEPEGVGFKVGGVRGEGVEGGGGGVAGAVDGDEGDGEGVAEQGGGVVGVDVEVACGVACAVESDDEGFLFGGGCGGGREVAETGEGGAVGEGEGERLHGFGCGAWYDRDL